MMKGLNGHSDHQRNGSKSKRSLRRNSDSASVSSMASETFHSARSQSGSGLSRFPYHASDEQQQKQEKQQPRGHQGRSVRRGPPSRTRSRSLDNSSHHERKAAAAASTSIEFSPNQLPQQKQQPTTTTAAHVDSDASPYNSGAEGRHHYRRGRRSTAASASTAMSSMDLDESAASALLLQESSTFPELQAEAQANSWNFAMEHRIFLKAVLELLAQRDKVATEVGMNDPNVFKSGPLKKASHLMRGIWKVKYVEIRRGMFSYYEDQAANTVTKKPSNQLHNSTTSTLGGGGTEGEGDGDNNNNNNNNNNEPPSSLLRKNIPLEANACHCRAVRLHQKAWNITPRGAIFELAIAGKPKRLWMANSREERQAWIAAIHGAMVGGSVTRGNVVTKNTESNNKQSPHREDIKKYLKVQGLLRNAKNKDDYVIALRTIFRHDLNVPVKIIIEQAEQESKQNNNNGGGGGPGDVKGAFHEGDVKFGVDQLYKDLLRDTLKIDNEVYQGNSGHAPERITGALARRILLCGRRSRDDDLDDDDSVPAASKYDMNESQALQYARDVLLSGNRTRSGGDSYFCVNSLCKNEDLVVLVPSSMEAEPVSVTVTRDVDDDAMGSDLHSKSGWLRTRRRTRNAWVKAYFVLSEGTLSFYEHALPRPHGLQGQLAISEATMTVARDGNGFVLTIVAKDKMERHLLFESEERLLVWVYALECIAKAKGGAAPAPLMKAMRGMMARVPRVSIVGMVGATSGGGANALANAQAAATRTAAFSDDSGAMVEGASLAEKALKEHVANLGLDFKDLEGRLAAYANQSSPIVKVAIEAGTVYKVCTLDPEGDESQDTWAIVEATFLQDFRVSGGPNARIIRGQETVRIDVSQCATPASLAALRRSGTDQLPSPSPGRQLPMAKLLRTFSDDVENSKYRSGQR